MPLPEAWRALRSRGNARSEDFDVVYVGCGLNLHGTQFAFAPSSLNLPRCRAVLLMRISTVFFISLSLFGASVHGAMTRSGTLVTETWRLADGPFTVSATATIPNGVTVTIEPGLVVNLASGANFIVANGGRLLAEGTAAQHIHFTRVGTTGSWGNLQISGGATSPETRIAYADFDANG